jgi:hypothetical protein
MIAAKGKIISVTKRCVSDVATIMSAIELVEDGAPCLGIALLICKTADGA